MLMSKRDKNEQGGVSISTRRGGENEVIVELKGSLKESQER